MYDWALHFPGAVTVCDGDLTIIYMNEKSVATFESRGGRALLGTSLEGCHKPESLAVMRRILETGEPNTYTIEKAGVRKLIYQAPWRQDGKIAGLVELSLVLPDNLPHHVRT